LLIFFGFSTTKEIHTSHHLSTLHTSGSPFKGSLATRVISCPHCASVDSSPTRNAFHLWFHQVVHHSAGMFLTTLARSKGFQFESSDMLHHFEHLCLQSIWHISYTSQQNAVPQTHAFPSNCHLLDLLVHLTTATLSGTINYRVYGILA